MLLTISLNSLLGLWIGATITNIVMAFLLRSKDEDAFLTCLNRVLFQTIAFALVYLNSVHTFLRP